MLRLFLPPNLPSAAGRDAIPIKVELDLTAPPAAELLAALALLQRWGVSPALPSFLQLTRAQLRQLVTALSGQPVFLWINQPKTPLLWIGPMLRGVSEHLPEPLSLVSELKPNIASPALSRPGLSDGVGQSPNVRPTLSRNGSPGAGSSRLVVDGSEHFLAITLPGRESVGYAEASSLLKSQGFVLEPSNRKWWLRDRHKVLNFLATYGERLRSLFHAEFTPNYEKNTAHLHAAEIACDAVDNGNGFNVTLVLRAGKVKEDQILAAASSNRGYVEDDGRVYLIDAAKLARLGQAQRALAGDTGSGLATRRSHRISPAGLAEAEAVLEEIAPHFQLPEKWRERSEALRNLSKLLAAPIPAAFDAQLRPYQRLGAAWLWHLARHGLGGILADEMGLGKTLQALALLTAFKAQLTRSNALAPAGSSSGCALVICPATLVENWRREATRFTPELRIFVHHSERRLERTETFQDYDLVVTSYGTLTRDRELFSEVSFTCVIADEAQHLKNRRTQNAQALRSLHAQSRFLLTGTPIENSLDDLRSLFEILMPGYVDKVPAGTRASDRVWFDERLRAKTAPYILRRTKTAVAPELPAKIEQVLYCELGAAQASLYRQWQERSERALIDLQAGGASENALRLATLTQLLRLRQLCCDPRLLPGALQNGEPADASETPYGDSAKLDAFRELLAESIDDGHRLLVFSQFTSLLALLRKELESQELAHCYLDGSMPVRARQAEVDRFNGSSDIPVFLISLKAGGTGLNLTGADIVVHFDPWWNPAVEAQATDRAHRLGQTRVVTSYKLICSGTVEEKVLQLQDSKRALLADVFEASDVAAAKLSFDDLKALLKT